MQHKINDTGETTADSDHEQGTRPEATDSGCHLAFIGDQEMNQLIN